MTRTRLCALTAVALGAAAALAAAPAGAQMAQSWRWTTWYGSVIYGSPQNGEIQALGVACDDDGGLSLNGPALSDHAAGQPEVMQAASALGSETLHGQLEEVDGVWFTVDVKPGSLVLRTLLANKPLRLTHGRYWIRVPGGGAHLLKKLVAECRPHHAAG